MEAADNENNALQKQLEFDTHIEKYFRKKAKIFFSVAGILATILGACGVAGLGYKEIIFTPLIKYIYPPNLIREDLLKLAPDMDSEKSNSLKNNVLDFLHDHVDSGYTKVMILPANEKFIDNNIPFYSTPEQDVEVTIHVETTLTDFQYVATVDQKPINDDEGLDPSISKNRPVHNVSITKKLNFDKFIKERISPNLHLLSVRPTDLQKEDVIITCVIIVRNKKNKVKE